MHPHAVVLAEDSLHSQHGHLARARIAFKSSRRNGSHHSRHNWSGPKPEQGAILAIALAQNARAHRPTPR